MLTTTTTMTDRDQLQQRAEIDLFFRIYPAEIYATDDDDMSEDAWLIIGLSLYGEIWIDDNRDLTTLIPEASFKAMSIPVVHEWANTRAKFERLYAKALADGLTVQLDG